jgi:hypothetical protein
VGRSPAFAVPDIKGFVPSAASALHDQRDRFLSLVLVLAEERQRSQASVLGHRVVMGEARQVLAQLLIRAVEGTFWPAGAWPRSAAPYLGRQITGRLLLLFE